MDNIIVIRGAGDIATGIAHRLYQCGFRLVLLELESPLVVRRGVSFANAVLEGMAQVEEVRAVKACCGEDIYMIWNDNKIPVLCDSSCKILEKMKPLAVVDVTLIKRNIGTNRGMAPITIGVGPGFEAGTEVDAVVETKRGHNLGKVIYKGSAQPDTGIPGSIMGHSKERLIRAHKDGVIRNILEIGSIVKAGDVIACIDSEPVCYKSEATTLLQK